MKVLNNLHMTAGSSMIAVGWTELNGNRMHVWLEIEKAPEGSGYDYQPVVPYRVKREYQMKSNAFDGPQVLYRNPPAGVGPRDEGYFPTRHLNTEAKAWRTVVAEALDRARHEGLFAKAQRDHEAAEAAEEQARKMKLVAKVREGVASRMDGFLYASSKQAATQLLNLTDDQLAEVASAVRFA